MLLYCKFICSLWVERQIKALHQNQSQKPRKTHRRPLNSKYQSISPTFFVKLVSLWSTVFLNSQAAAGWYGERSEGVHFGGFLWHSGLSSWGTLLLKGFFSLRASIMVKTKSLFLLLCIRNVSAPSGLPTHTRKQSKQKCIEKLLPFWLQVQNCNYENNSIGNL